MHQILITGILSSVAVNVVFYFCSVYNKWWQHWNCNDVVCVCAVVAADDGGSTVLEYNVEMVEPDSIRRQVYTGRETECTVARCVNLDLIWSGKEYYSCVTLNVFLCI